MAAAPFAENSLLKLLFEKSPTPIAYMDLSFNFIHVNQAYASADNKNVDFFPEKNHFDLYPNDENKNIFNDVVKTGETYATKAKAFEYAEVPEKGTTFWDWSLTLVKDNQGKDAGVLLQLIDVTWQIKIERQLYESVKNELRDYDQELETIIEAKTKLLQETIETLKFENAERVKAEALMLKAKEEAEKANISKSQFLSRMSHELRTPMNAILGFSQLLEFHDLNEKQSSYNDEILMAGNHLLSMISDILDLSRIEEGSLSVTISDVLLARIIDESISLVKHKLDFRSIVIHNLIEPDDKITLKVDETRLKEVLVNLLTNAVKYNFDDGLVSIGYKSLGEGHIRLYVSDTGKGLTQKEQAKVFEPFNRLGAEYTDIEGVGIGLAISEKLMAMMDGAISVESEKGKGSTFNLDCPIGKKSVISVTENNKIDLDDTASQYNILYVEDNKSNQKLISNLFENYSNFNLTLTLSAEEGLEKISNHQFDLIIMDINLPGMDGYDALEKLNMNAETKDIPIIALSASAGLAEIKKGVEAGFNQYMTKPVVLPELISVISDELNRASKL